MKMKATNLRKLLFLSFTISLILALGCQKEEEEKVTDEEAIESIVSTSAFFNTSGHYEGGAASDSGDTTPQWFYSLPDTTIPLFWGRQITERPDPSIDISIQGDSAYVEYTGYQKGFFHIWAYIVDSGWALVSKPLSETFTIKAVFKRTGSETEANRGWELTHVSGVHGFSDSVHTVTIDSVRLQSESYPDTVFLNPVNQFFHVDSILTFLPGEEVMLTLYTNDDTARPFLHIFQKMWPYHIRIPFLKKLGDGDYTHWNPWVVQSLEDIRLAVFDLVPWDLFLDSEYPYDFDGWLFPYQVVGE